MIPKLEMPGQLWVYGARLERIVDGDTLDVFMDLGRRTYAVERLRLLNVNAPENKGLTRPAGQATMAYVATWLREAAASDLDWPLRLQTEKDDAFGRYLSHVWRLLDGEYLNFELVERGFAVPFMVK